jgi:hypothetical protein
MKQRIRGVCCVCGTVYRKGPTDKNGRVSHGYCTQCAQMAIKQLMEGEYNDQKHEDKTGKGGGR